MSERIVRDDWLVPTLKALVGAEHVAQLQSEAPPSLWESAVQRGLVSDDDLLAALSARFRMPIADLSPISVEAKELVPESLARKYRILPLRANESALEIATSDPNDLDCEKTLGFVTGRTIRMHLAAPARILDRIDEVYRPENAVEKLLEGMTQYDVQSLVGEEQTEELDLSVTKASERPIIKLVDHIVAEGIHQRASDIHLESQEAGVVVAFRVDGVLRQAMSLPRAVGIPLVSRIKIMSGLDIADRLRPQDGRARVSVNGVRVDLRVSTLPASTGEKVVVRILDSRSTVLSLEGLGLAPGDLARVQNLVNLREGIVLVTGPTGAGKTTTLYSALRTIQARGVNIVTVEDPVEYRLTGIVQVQVNEKAGLTFAVALRSILRQDPDVVLVGEIRDRETATIATQASLTGHLVLSTLHTIDAASAVARLVDVGVEPFKIAAALKGVIAQRLLRRLCVHCKAPQTDPVPERLRRWFPEPAALFRPVGCPECGGTGYRGRFAVLEVLTVTDEVERAISASESTERISEAAKRGGMRTLWESGVESVQSGIVDLEETLRVLEVPLDSAPPDVIRRPARPASRTPSIPPKAAATAPPRPSGGVRAAPARATPAPSASFLPEDVLEMVDEISQTGAGRGHQKVLLVEDEEALRLVLRDLLEREGFAVVEAADGVQALDQIDRHGPDAMILDLSLPRLDGYAVLSHVRSKLATASLPILVLTARADEESEVRVFESGANDFMTKPFRPRALSARLKALLRNHQRT